MTAATAPPRGKYFYHDLYLRWTNGMTALRPLQAMQTVEGQRIAAAPRNPAHLCGPLTRRVDLVHARLMEIRGAIRALEVEHEGLLVEVTEIMEELDGDDL